MTEFHDYYELLNVQSTADTETVKKAIKETRKRYRRIESSPDQQQRANAERVMSLLGEAEDVLLNKESRAEYDAQYHANKVAQSKQQQAGVSTSRDWVQEAEAYYDKGQYNNALFAAIEATRANSEDEHAWYIRTWSAYNINRFDEAEFSANEMIKLNPNIANMHAILGDIYTEQHRDDAAIAEYELGKQLDPTSPYYPMRIAVIHGSHDTELGLRLAREAHNKFPNDQTIKDYLAFMLMISVQEGMSTDGDSFYFTNVRQIAHAKKLVEEYNSLGSIEDSDTRETKSRIDKLIVSAESRQFVMPPNWYLILLLLHVVGLFGGLVGNIFHWIVLAVLVIYGYFNVFPQGYTVNARALGPAVCKTGIQ